MPKAKAKPKRKPRPKSRQERTRLPWDQIRALYVGSVEHVSYEKLAEQFGCTKQAIDKRASVEGWVDERRASVGRVLAEAMQNAFEDKKKAMAAVLRFEHSESLSHAAQLRVLRKANGADWQPREHKQHAEAFGLVMKRLRLSLGMPTEITEWPKDGSQPIRVYIPAHGGALPGGGDDGDA